MSRDQKEPVSPLFGCKFAADDNLVRGLADGLGEAPLKFGRGGADIETAAEAAAVSGL